MTGMSNARNYIEFGTMDPKATTFGNLLKNAGYATGIAGKWQLGRDKELPKKFGFDESCLWQHTRRPPRYANPGLEYNGVKNATSPTANTAPISSTTSRSTSSRGRKIEAVLPLLPDDAHARALPADARQPRLGSESRRRKGQSQRPKHFAEMVAYMDKLVGKLVAKLDELGLRDNTLIMFLGDNGTGKGAVRNEGRQVHPRRQRHDHARGMHVPLIANWPGTVAAGKVH